MLRHFIHSAAPALSAVLLSLSVQAQEETPNSDGVGPASSEAEGAEPVVLEESTSPSDPAGESSQENPPSKSSASVEVEDPPSTGAPVAHQPSTHPPSKEKPADPPAALRLPAGSIDPGLPQFDEGGAPQKTSIRAGGDWEFEFHGFLRAPMRMGLGPKNDGTDGNEEHALTRSPDTSFTDWRYTHNIPGPWTQLLLSVGNGRAKGTVGIASFNHTNASYRNLQANLGINEAFLTLDFPDAFGRYGGLKWNVGSFSNRYGTAGKYNAGRYNTYLFGRTRVTGETLTAALHLTPTVTLTLEHGIGAKLDVIPSETVNPRPAYLPYGGPEAQGTTWVNHAHVFLGLGKMFEFGAHFLHTRSPDDRQLPDAPSNPGSMTISGGEVRVRGGAFGHGYLGYSHIDAKEILSLADAVEVLHSFAGWNFKNNYFGRYNPRTGQAAPDTSGQVDSLLFQYDLSLGALARYPTRFRGEGPDLNLSLFAMFNKVTSENTDHTKFKWGGELLYEPFGVFGLGARYDLVQPDMSDADQSFAILSPKAVFQTQFITREQITLQYSRYFLGETAYPAFPYANIDEADPNVFMVVGKMWW